MAAVMVSNGTPTRLPSRSFGDLMPALRWMAMKPWRNAREGKTGIATNGHCLLAKRWTNSEFSSSEFVQRFANKQCPFVAIPVFPSRAFRHGFIAIHRKAGIKSPKDLEGKRVGVPLLTMTAAIYINGLLQHEYGVDLRKIHWVQGAMNTGGAHGSPTVLPLLNPIPIEQNTSKKSMSDLIEERVVDATLGTSLPEAIRTNPDIARLFPNYVELEKEFYKRTRIYPIMHLVAIRKQVY